MDLARFLVAALRCAYAGRTQHRSHAPILHGVAPSCPAQPRRLDCPRGHACRMDHHRDRRRPIEDGPGRTAFDDKGPRRQCLPRQLCGKQQRVVLGDPVKRFGHGRLSPTPFAGHPRHQARHQGGRSCGQHLTKASAFHRGRSRRLRIQQTDLCLAFCQARSPKQLA